MTEGTSQGLFIVVAIVIFGIFVVLAYILFEDTLSPALASMFTNATEQSHKRLENTKEEFAIGVYNPRGEAFVERITDTSVVYRTPGNLYWGEGIFIPAEQLEQNKKYELTFDLNLLEGSISRIGGSIEITDRENTHIYVNGVKISSGEQSMHLGVDYVFEPLKTYEIKFEFMTDNLGIDSEGNYYAIIDKEESFPNVYIQPNRGQGIVEPYKVSISNITFRIKE